MEPREPGGSRAPRGFDEEHLQRLEEFFDSRGIDVKCPVCGSEALDIKGLMGVPEVVYERGGVTETGGVLAMVYGVCQNCTYVMFFHARLLGMLD
jgi:hypothetical protein